MLDKPPMHTGEKERDIEIIIRGISRSFGLDLQKLFQNFRVYKDSINICLSSGGQENLKFCGKL